MMRFVCIFLFSSFLFLTLLGPLPTQASHTHPEKDYVTTWCHDRDGQIEVVLPDKTRCDCVTNTHATEFDFAAKWYESLGQSLYYGLQTEKKAGIVLILEDEKDWKYWFRLNSTILYYDLPIDTWKIEAGKKQRRQPLRSIIELLLLGN